MDGGKKTQLNVLKNMLQGTRVPQAGIFRFMTIFLLQGKNHGILSAISFQEAFPSAHLEKSISCLGCKKDGATNSMYKLHFSSICGLVRKNTWTLKANRETALKDLLDFHVFQVLFIALSGL